MRRILLLLTVLMGVSLITNGAVSIYTTNTTLPTNEHTSITQSQNSKDTLDKEEVLSESSHEKHSINLAPLFFIILSLFIGTATRHLFRKGPLPYTILLLIFGLILGALARFDILNTFNFNLIADSINWAGNIDPHLILYLFLPTLIFEAAY